MEYIADIHFHSKYAGACSEQLTLENIDKAVKEKGIGIVGTGDFTHPLWMKDIKEKLEGENGIYGLRGSGTGTKFIISGEVSTIFSNDKSVTSRGMFDRSGSVKKIHHVILSPSIEAAEHLNEELKRFGNLAIDGRPQFNMSASELVELIFKIDKNMFVFPAHAWTPWFGVLGSISGFDSIEEAYEDQAKHIYAIETGLSADPAMIWRVSKLDKYALLSSSDAHSLPKIGREAILMDIDGDITYDKMTSAIKEKRLKMTVEFYPEEGKYHYDGHRNCKVSMPPSESKKFNNICPVCRKKLTLGVMHRVEDLADREEGYVPRNSVPFVNAIPLQEVIAHVLKKSTGSPYVQRAYDKLVGAFGTEFNVLLKGDVERIKEIDRDTGIAIENVRENRVNIVPGYDGVFGIIDIANEIKEKKGQNRQSQISDF
ncbi:MAG: DNA helicase UvrD [Candidatus Micrarchaeota archaeon]|nr:DNA helicase UvrD [Candidatus Micrarchaeota archaeon]MDE1850034.1 DNA helicase UvrD [Candidatus Micrarchaeota archaeon]